MVRAWVQSRKPISTLHAADLSLRSHPVEMNWDCELLGSYDTDENGGIYVPGELAHSYGAASRCDLAGIDLPDPINDHDVLSSIPEELWYTTNPY
jgi:hypothetical protein